jgi:hypothetical protein
MCVCKCAGVHAKTFRCEQANMRVSKCTNMRVSKKTANMRVSKKAFRCEQVSENIPCAPTMVYAKTFRCEQANMRVSKYTGPSESKLGQEGVARVSETAVT